jgi:hypothetical protein
VDGAFLGWLVENRSLNQKQTLRLYTLITAHRAKVESYPFLSIVSQVLIAVCFSLWRAVFLSDVEENQDNIEHAVEFLENLIAHNSVTIQMIDAQKTGQQAIIRQRHNFT